MNINKQSTSGDVSLAEWLKQVSVLESGNQERIAAMVWNTQWYENRLSLNASTAQTYL